MLFEDKPSNWDKVGKSALALPIHVSKQIRAKSGPKALDSPLTIVELVEPQKRQQKNL